MEWLCTPFAHWGPWAPNTLSAVAAAACAWLTARLCARHGMRHAWLAGAAFAFVPPAYIAGTSSIDYLWAIAFALAAWIDAESGHWARAGLWLGLAVGTRLTSALFVVPLAWLVWQNGRDRGPGRAAGLAAIGAAIGAAFYVPGLLRYGWGLFTYSEIHGGQSSALQFLGGILHPGDSGVALPLVAGQATVLLWGPLGLAAIALALLALPWQPRQEERAARIGRATAPALLAIGVLEVAFYLRLPHDEGYLLPLVPFVLLTLASWLTPRRFAAVCVALLLSPFVFGVDVSPPKKGLTPAHPSPGAFTVAVARETVVIEPLRGLLLRDLAKRDRMEQVAGAIASWWPSRPARFRIAAGNLVSMLYYLHPEDPHRSPFVRTCSAAERSAAVAEGIPFYVLPDVVARTRISEQPISAAGLIPLAGAEVSP